MKTLEPHFGQYDLVYADPPWFYHGDPEKMGSAAKHYTLMPQREIEELPVRQLFRDKKNGALFLWATCPRLNYAVDALRAWGLYYRGVAFVWVKTRKSDGQPMGPAGVPPTATKPTTELVLFATTNKRGRPFPLMDAAVPQVVMAPRGRHSEKPEEVRTRIDRLYGCVPSIELFARKRAGGPHWAAWGDEV